MSDLIRREDVIKALDDAFDSIPMEQTTEILKARRVIRTLPSADRPNEVIAQITFDEEKLREIVKEAVERFKEEYEITDRPQGEWIGEADGYADGEFVYDTWYCSNCDYAIDDDEPPTWNYCPNCGAKMAGEKEGE